jgi:spore maturation protein CgeB
MAVGASGAYIAETLKKMGCEVYSFDYRTPLENGQYQTLNEMNNALLKEMSNAPLDALLVFKGEILNPHVIRQIKEWIKVPALLWYPDELYLHNWEINLMKAFDHVFVIQDTAINGLKLHGINAHYLVEGCYPEMHTPVTPAAEYSSDVMFAGSPYQRNYWLLDILHHCLKKGYVFKLWGNNWWDEVLLNYWQKKPIYNLEHSLAVSSSKVCLELTSPPAKVGNRVFQELAAGGLMITEELPCLKKWGLENMVHYIGYPADDHDALLKAIDFAINNPDRVDIIRDAAAAFAHSNNTYEHRLHRLFQEAGLE